MADKLATNLANSKYTTPVEEYLPKYKRLTVLDFLIFNNGSVRQNY